MTIRPPVAVLVLALFGCGPTVVRAYDGPDLSPQQVASLWSNESMTMSVDEKTIVSTSDLSTRRRVELAPGKHVVQVRCQFPDSVEYNRVEGGNGRAIEGSRYSRAMTFMLIAEAGHSYVARAHFGVDEAGKPDCKVLFPDITGEPGGEKLQTF
jgi:hypothetical protein